jgi:4-hydroxy-tetrahydrodipicolinate reductase
MRQSINFVQMGLGPIGLQIVRYACERPGIGLVSAVDTDPAKAGKDVGTLLEADPLGVTVTADGAAALSDPQAHVAVVATVSSVAAVEALIQLCIDKGKNVVSSTEELAHPWDTHPEVARRIDRAARAKGVTVLATGVNPGLAMDTLPLTLSGACRRIDRILVQRHQDAARRRLPFQRKIGAGLSPDHFAEKVAAGTIRHVGFTESIQMIARNLGWVLERTEDQVAPVISEVPVISPYLSVAVGEAAGVRQVAKGYRKGRAVITLELEAYLGHPAPKDAVTIDGDPPLYSEVKGGINGDVATCAMVVNALPKVIAAAPGLKTMPEIATVTWFDQLPHYSGSL